jgi:5-methylcytosine-specific restriction endonuclease McrA
MEVKRCSKCGEEKPATAEYFFRQKGQRYGLRPECKICKAIYNSANKERINQVTRAYRAAHKKRNSEYFREYYRRWRKANPELAIQKQRAYVNANREHIRSLDRRRKARKRNALGVHTADDIRAQHKAQRGKCYYCQEKVGDIYDVDHVIPLSRGGSNGPENLVIACVSCNRSKNNKLPHEWAQGGRLL